MILVDKPFIILMLMIISLPISSGQECIRKEYNFENGMESLDSNWLPETESWSGSDESCASGKSLTTGVISCPNNASILVRNVCSGAGQLSFSWKKSGANTKFELYLDDKVVEGVACSYNWASRSVTIPRGTHTIKWLLSFGKSNDGECIAGSRGEGWLCNVVIPLAPLNESQVTIPGNESVFPPVPIDVTSIEITSTEELKNFIDTPQNDINLFLDDGEYNVPIVLSGMKNIIIKSESEHGAILNAQDAAEFGILLNNCTNVTIDGLVVSGSPQGILLNRSNYCTIINNVISYLGRVGLKVSNSSKNNDIINNMLSTESPDRDPAFVISEGTNNLVRCNSISKMDGYTYCVINSRNNRLYVDGTSIYSEGRGYEIRHNDEGNACFVPMNAVGREVECISELYNGNLWYGRRQGECTR